MTKKAMRIIGVTGGVGAGKSTVLSILQKEYGARIIEMDAVGKELMKPGTSCFEEICRAFGKRILLPEGGLDRKKLAETVFRDEAALERLSAIVHPAVRKEVEARLAAAEGAGAPLAVLESAILLEAGYKSLCTQIWYVRADRETRIRRLSESRGYSREKSLSVMENQKSEEEFMKEADVVVDNSGGLSQLKERIAGILHL